MKHHKPIAIVTGGASGMGRLASIKLHAQGYNIIALDMDQSGLDNLASDYVGIKGLSCNVADETQVESMVDDAFNHYGRIDRLVHAAGIMPMGRLTDMCASDVVKMMRINYEGTVYLTKAVMKYMLPANKGDIVLFGSLAGELRSPNLGAYSASKAATNTYARELIRENEKTALRILLVCPSMVNTPLLSPEKTHIDDSWMFRVARWGLMLEPEYVIDAIEQSLNAGRTELFPGIPGKIGFFMSRVMPHIGPKIMEKLEPKADSTRARV